MLGSSGRAQGRECWGPVGGQRVESAGVQWVGTG